MNQPVKLWGQKLQAIHWCWEGRNSYEDVIWKIGTRQHEKNLPHYESEQRKCV